MPFHSHSTTAGWWGEKRKGTKLEKKKKKLKTEMTADVQESKSKHTRDQKWTLFNIDKTKTMCKFSAYVAFNKATNGQTDIKHEKE